MSASAARVHQEAPKATETPLPALKVQESTKDLVYRFKISRRAAPIEFRNLWELAVKGPEDKEWRTEIDADMLSTVVSRISYIFELDGL